ncbi:MAG: hypothetical protein WAT91_15880 [Saprospiraceae bacterium]
MESKEKININDHVLHKLKGTKEKWESDFENNEPFLSDSRFEEEDILPF